MSIKVKMLLEAPKKHSIKYRPADDAASKVLTGIYIGKSPELLALGNGSPPAELFITLSGEETPMGD